jgi:hypothetical protein
MELDRGTIERWLRSNLPEALEKLGGLTLQALQENPAASRCRLRRAGPRFPFQPKRVAVRPLNLVSN